MKAVYVFVCICSYIFSYFLVGEQHLFSKEHCNVCVYLYWNIRDANRFNIAADGEGVDVRMIPRQLIHSSHW